MAQQINLEISKQTKKAQNLLQKFRNYEIYNEVKEEIEEILVGFKNKFNRVQTKIKVFEKKMNSKRIKIYFCGRMLSGKTNLINGIIGDDLFLSTTNHTTNCFVHIRKSEDKNYKIIYKDKEYQNDPNKEEAMKKIDDLSTGGDEMEKNKFVEIFIPINNGNKILTENVELIDSPGSGNKNKINKYVQNYVADADIFIFVLYNEITEDEENFLKFQAENSSKSEVFILINKWDESDKEKFIKKTRNFLFAKCHLLISQLTGNIEDRIFFVSAKEILDIRKNKNNDYLSNSNKKGRYEEFQKFENNISKCIRNFEKNKIDFCTLEIKKLKNDLNKLDDELSKKISQIDLKSSIKIFDVHQRKIIQFKYTVKEKCEKRKSECQVEIKWSLTKTMDITNLTFNKWTQINKINFDPKKIDKQILEHYSKIDKSIEKLINNLVEKYDNLLMEMKNVPLINIENFQIFEKIPGINLLNVDSFLKTKGQIKNILNENSATFYIFDESDNIKFNEEKLNKLNKEIHKNDEKILKTLDEIILYLENCFTEKADKLLEQIKDKIFNELIQ